MADEKQGGAVYRVDWQATGLEEFSTKLREFITLKKEADRLSAIPLQASVSYQGGRIGGLTPSGVVNPAGHFIVSSAAVMEQAQRQQLAVELQQRQQQARQQAQEERTYQQAERQARQADTQAERETRRREAQQETVYTRADRQARQADAQSGQRYQQTHPAVFASMQSHAAGLKTDEEWLDYNRAIKERYETALKNNEQLNDADRSILSNSNSIAGLIGQRRSQEEEQNKKGAGGIASALGWMPGIPGGQNIYMAQMALEALGITGGALLGGTLAVAGLGIGTAGYMMTSSTLAEETAASQRVSAMTGGSGSAPRPIDQATAARITGIGQAFGLTRDQTLQAVGTGLAGLNFSSPSGITSATQLGLAESQTAGIAPTEGIQLAGTLLARFGQNAQQAADSLLRINQAASVAQVNVTQFATDLTNLGAYLQPGTNYGQLGVLEGVAGQNGLNLGQMMGSSLTSTGSGLMQQAAFLGMSPDAMAKMQQQNPIGLFRIQQQKFQQLEANAAPGSQTATAEAVFQNVGMMPTDASANLVAQAFNGQLDDAQVQQLLQQMQQPTGTTPGQFVQGAQGANLAAQGPMTRLGVLRQQAGTVAASNIPLLEMMGAGAATGAIGGAAFLGIGAIPGALAGGAAGLGLGLAGLIAQIHQAQQQASASGQAGQFTSPGATSTQRIELVFTDGNTGQPMGGYTVPQGQSSVSVRVTPGPGLTKNVQAVPTGTPTPTSLTGR